jgi:hypothetical protein
MWLKKQSDHEGFCISCNGSFSVAKGFQAVTQHATTPKHERNFNAQYSSKQLRLEATSTTERKADNDQVNFHSIFTFLFLV